MNEIDQNLPKCKQMIKENIEFDNIIKIVLNETKLFKLKDIEKWYESEIKKWVEKRDNVTLFVILSNKIDISHYFYTKFKHMLPKHKFINEYNNEYTAEFISFYDISLIGDKIAKSQIKAFEEVDQHRKITNMKYLPENNFTCKIFIPIFSVLSLENIENSMEYLFIKKIEFLTMEEVPSFYEIMNKHKISKEIIIKFLEHFNVDLNMDDYYPLSLDYKNLSGTYSFSEIINSCKMKPDKSYMKEPKNIFRNLIYESSSPKRPILMKSDRIQSPKRKISFKGL